MLFLSNKIKVTSLKYKNKFKLRKILIFLYRYENSQALPTFKNGSIL